MLFEALKRAALNKTAASKVADVRIGLCYTGVLLDDGKAGVAYTCISEVGRCCSTKSAQQFAGSSAAETVALVTSDNLMERTVGIATANSLLNVEGSEEEWEGCEIQYGDFRDTLIVSREDRVGMVGLFEPLIPALRNQAQEVLVFEKDRKHGEEIYADEQIAELLPRCTVVIITATSIINATFERIASAARNARIVALLGASTPLAPNIFKQYGVTHLSGIMITDPVSILRVISEGKGMRFFGGLIKKVNLILPR